MTLRDRKNHNSRKMASRNTFAEVTNILGLLLLLVKVSYSEENSLAFMEDPLWKKIIDLNYISSHGSQHLCDYDELSGLSTF